jgi:hypothetical protein
MEWLALHVDLFSFARSVANPCRQLPRRWIRAGDFREQIISPIKFELANANMGERRGRPSPRVEFTGK